MPTVFTLQAAFVAAGVAPVCAALGRTACAALQVLAFPALLLAAQAGYGWPSAAVVRADLDRTLGQCTEDLVAGRCTHLAGDYWQVWTRVFHAKLVLYERGEDREVWGVTYRSDVLRPLWASVPPVDLSAAVLLDDDGEGRGWLSHYGFPELTVAERRATLLVLRPARP